MDYSKKVLMDNIYYLAKKNNITLGKLEELVGLSAGYLSRLNREDNNSNPSIDVVSSFSKQLKVPVDILIKYDLSTLSPDDTYMLQFLTVLAGKTANNEIHWNLIPSAHFYQRNSIIVVILAITLLSVFSKIKPFSNKFVNVVSGCTFGVYLIHDNNYMREYLWGNIFDNSKYAESNYLIVHFILSVIIVYVACTVIEYIRKYVLEKYVFKNIINRINSCADSIYSRLLSLIEKR